MEFDILISILSLVALEAVLGIDNLVFVSILAQKLPQHQQAKARRLGLILAGALRIILLLLISIILKLDYTIFKVLEHEFSGKDLILLSGGLFLLYKSTKEIYHKMEGEQGDVTNKITASTFANVIVQILIMDLVFSVDSIITAIGMVREVWVMFVAVIMAVIIMIFASDPISKFINRHPSFKMLALAFLLLIGFSLMAEGLGVAIPKGYIYFAMAFSFLVDILQMRMHKGGGSPVKTREHYTEEEGQAK